jgi:hypothetical protein
MLSVSPMTAGMVAGSGAGARSKREVERKGLDQDIKLCGLEIIITASPIKHEECLSDRTVEIDRP